MLTLDAARTVLGERVGPLPARELALVDALGCRLASVPPADTELPPFDTSAMDGYAARHADLVPGQALPVAFEVAAGGQPAPLPPKTAARIFTGAPLPAGADTVVPQEEAELRPDGRVGLSALPAGSHLRRRGEILARGEPTATAGTVLTPQRLALLAAAGCARVGAVPRPRAAIVVTGNELLAVTDAPRGGMIRNSNGPMLEALAAEARLPVIMSELVGDDLDALLAALRRAAGAELVLVSGGVSVGAYDLVPAAVTAAGGEIALHRVAIQPGKPILVARIASGWLVGLPGNPVSVLAGWRMFARPLAEALAGDALAFDEAPLPARLTGPADNPGWRTQLRPARLLALAGGLAAEPIAWRGSHDLVAAADADGLLRLEPGAEHGAGARVAVYPLPWRWPA